MFKTEINLQNLVNDKSTRYKHTHIFFLGGWGRQLGSQQYILYSDVILKIIWNNKHEKK